MKKWIKKGSAVLLAVAMALTLFAGINITTLTAYAAPNTALTLNINTDGSVYLQENGGSLQYSRDNVNWANYEGTCTITGSSTINKIVVMTGSHTIKLKDVNIDVSKDANNCAFDIQDGAGDVTVELEGTNILKSGIDRAGIEKNSADSKSFTITSAAGDGKTDGSLTATSTYGAGIGGGRGGSGGNGGDGNNIVINGGTVKATSIYGAGIGGGNGGNGGIGKDGTNNGNGGNGGNGGSGGNIIINGGTITATSTYGAGIGGGNGARGGNGVGDGNGGNGGNGGDGRNIIVRGGTVTATGGATGIGGGDGARGGDGERGGEGGNGGNGESITIISGIVTVISDYGAGIGGGSGGAGGAGGTGNTNVSSSGSPGSQSDNKIMATDSCKANAWAGEDENNTTQFLTDLTTTHTIADGDIAKYMKIEMKAAAPAPSSPTPTTYAVTVNKGTGAGSYEAGKTITITADAAPNGQEFDKWEVVSGGVTLASATSATTTFTMPANTVEVTATYKDKSASPTPVYHITDGAKGTWTKGSDATLTFRGDGAFEDFVSVKVDGKVIDKENYTAKAGSTVITLKASYLNTLTAGEHTLEMAWKDGSASTTFTVKAAASTGDASSPKTGDTGNISTWLILMMISAGGMAYILLDRRKKNYSK